MPQPLLSLRLSIDPLVFRPVLKAPDYLPPYYWYRGIDHKGRRWLSHSRESMIDEVTAYYKQRNNDEMI